ncbi:MAG: hypothetical protein ACP5NQ_03730 [Vulcanisaeta sp.]
MFPEAVPIITRGIKHIPKLVFTSKLALELNNDMDFRIIKRIKSLGKEVFGIARINNELNARIPKTLDQFDKAIIILNSRVGMSWIRYIMGLVNTTIGLTLDALMKFIELKPHLLNLPNELLIDPIIDDGVQILPKDLSKQVIEWLMDYVDSGGDLYILVRDGSLNNIDLISHSSLVFSYDIKIAEIYNSIVKGNLGNTVRADCDFCGGSPSPICVLLCPNIEIIKELRVE